ncbi:MAG: DNA-directed RNA polymerase subunit omega [Pseudomonadota bacterium]
MARVTVEDCLRQVDNRFQLIHLAAKRVEQLRHGAVPLVHAPKNKEVVLALREIAAGRVMPGAPGEELPPVEYFEPEPMFALEEYTEPAEADTEEAPAAPEPSS